MKNSFSIVGYSGHSYVVLDSALKSKLVCRGYFDKSEKELNPFRIDYFGKEDDISSDETIFISIGNNKIRRNIFQTLLKNKHVVFLNIIDKTASVSKMAFIEPDSSILIGVNSTVNSLAQIETGVIINSASIIEHEVRVGRFSHVGPGSVICGNVNIGENVFIGANAVVKEGVTIGDNSVIGAGAVVVRNIPANSTYVGNPAKKINKK